MGSHENLNVNSASRCKTLWVMLSKFISGLHVSSIMVYLTLCDTRICFGSPVLCLGRSGNANLPVLTKILLGVGKTFALHILRIVIVGV